MGSEMCIRDRAQAEILFEVLSEDRLGELANALTTAMERGPAWREAIETSQAKSARVKEISARILR